MPIYEYECPTHGRYEVSQRITEAALTKCTVDACGQSVRKLISTSSFALKGGGWYVTDYGRSGSGAKSEANKSDEAKPSDAKPSDTKPSDAKPSEAKAGGGCGRAECGTGSCAGVASA